MLYRTHTPAPSLAPRVDYLWSLRDAPVHARERIVPSGTLELVVNLHEDELRIYDAADPRRCRRFSGAVVSGAYRGSFVIDTREHASIFGVHFRPGGASPFLLLPAGELADAHVDLEVLWGHRARELRERLCAARDDRGRFRILEEALLASLGARREHRAVQPALDRLARGIGSVGALASELGLSRRRFVEVFTADVGMTPKLFARVHRFQRALARAQQRCPPAWCDLALACGYFDQAHMIRDFVDFSGLSPTELVKKTREPVKVHHLALGGSGGSHSSNTTGVHRPHGVGEEVTPCTRPEREPNALRR